MEIYREAATLSRDSTSRTSLLARPAQPQQCDVGTLSNLRYHCDLSIAVSPHTHFLSVSRVSMSEASTIVILVVSPPFAASFFSSATFTIYHLPSQFAIYHQLNARFRINSLRAAFRIYPLRAEPRISAACCIQNIAAAYCMQNISAAC